MHKTNRITRGAIALTLFFLAAIHGGPVFAGDRANGKELDLAKTAAFMREIETRPDFPVSVVLANDYVYSLLALGQPIDPVRKSAIIHFIKGLQQNSGGFVPDKASTTASVLYTDLALETLAYLNATSAIETARVKAFVSSLKNPDGGFGFSPASKTSTLASTFYAIRILKKVGGLDLADKAKTATYIRGFEKKKGGFGYVKGEGAADAKNTYLAAFVLNSLGSLSDSTRENAVRFLGATPYVNKNNRERPELGEQLYAVKALKELKAGAKVDRKLAMSLVRKLYIPVNGGFGPLVGYGSTPDSTTEAIRVLAETGKLREPVLPIAHM